MKDPKDVYLIFRRYNKEEQKNDHSMQPKSPHYFGWTPSKILAQAFLEQRDKSKYVLQKTDTDEIAEKMRFTDTLIEETRIDILELRSHKTGEDVMFLTTPEEQTSIETEIRKLFTKLSSFDSLYQESKTQSALSDFVNMMSNLQPKYFEALLYIGYHPDEFNYLYNGPTEDEFDYGYIPSPFNVDLPDIKREILDDPSRVVVFSLESVIKVIKDEL